jgi:lysozyme
VIDYARGIDVNHYHRPKTPADWAAVWKAGIEFVGMKATQGTDYTDPSLVDSRAAVLDATHMPPLMLYHFADGVADAAAQAHHFLSVVGDLDYDEIPILDLERGKSGALPFLADGAPVSEMFNRAEAWCAIVEAATGNAPLLYTRRAWLDCGNPSLQWATERDLWVPRYRNVELGPGELPAPWAPDRWRFWQWSDGTTPPVEIPGVGAVDVNVFNGTAADLAAWIDKRGGGS